MVVMVVELQMIEKLYNHHHHTPNAILPHDTSCELLWRKKKFQVQ